MSNFNTWLHNELKRRGIKPAEFARMLGPDVTRVSVYHWTNNVKPRAHMLARIGAVLNCTIDDMLMGRTVENLSLPLSPFTEPSKPAALAPALGKEYIQIPWIDVKRTCRSGEMVLDTERDPLYFWVGNHGLNEDCLAATICDNDLIIIDLSDHEVPHAESRTYAYLLPSSLTFVFKVTPLNDSDSKKILGRAIRKSASI